VINALDVVALQMVTGDRAKYLGLIFAIAFSSFLIAQQISIFSGLMNRTRSQIADITDADIWVMDPATQYIDEVYGLKDSDLYRVRGVQGVLWAVPLFKGQPVAKASDGRFRVVILLGVDDSSLAGAPPSLKMILGTAADLSLPDSAILDLAGYHFFFPGETPALGKTLEMNDHIVHIVGIYDSSPPYTGFPVMFTRYSVALNSMGAQRRQMSFVLAKGAPGSDLGDVTRRIHSATGLKAATSEDFGWMTIWYYIRNTGLPINFGLTVAVALVVGTVVAGQTFYIFTIENLKQFGALRAMGVTDAMVARMILLQALVVGAIGYALGMGMTAAFFALTTNTTEAAKGVVLVWQVMVLTAAVVLFIVVFSSIVSMRKVASYEPAAVFRT
jgi:putative ABC transport system permease protein